MRPMRETLLVVLLLLWLLPAVHAGTTDLDQWLPGESHRGGKHEDARLDQPVRFWRVGIPLDEVFTGVEQQTGVRLSFFPANDENRRVRVHLFLNPKQPPALRDLMVQLSWAVACTFSVTEEDGKRVYYLLGTSIGRGAAETLQALEAQKHREVTAMRSAVVDKLSELEEALKLPREEAVRRYQGKDDRALLDMLDPPRRAATQIAVLRVLPWLQTLEMEPDEPPIYHGYGLGYSAGEMSPEEQAAWIAAFGMDPDGIEFQDPKVCFGVGASTAGSVDVSCPKLVTAAGEVVNAGSYTTGRYQVLDLGAEAALQPEDEITLWRALGEQISEAHEKAFVDQRKKELAAAAEVARVKASGATLTPQATGALAALVLALESGKVYPEWRIKEAVAHATGMHVVSDGLLYASTAAAPSGQARALATLEALCSQPARGFMRSPEWEWGDAGTFLRFRTANRDVWRAARLPEATIDWLDTELRPFLPKPEDQAKAIDLVLTVDPEQWTRQWAHLNDLQMLHGARVLHGDPRDPAEVARHATWEVASPYAQVGLSLLRFLGSLDSAQWQLAWAGKLRWPEEVTPDQGKLLMQALVEKVMIPPAVDAYPHLHIALDEAEPHAFGQEQVGLMGWDGVDALGHAMGGGGPALLTGPTPKQCYRVTLTASAMDQPTRSDLHFEKYASFLPKTLTVHTEVPELTSPGP